MEEDRDVTIFRYGCYDHDYPDFEKDKYDDFDYEYIWEW